MPNILLPVPHRKQIQDADCLAACVAMTLDFFERPIQYDDLLQILETTVYGAIASRVKRLTATGVAVLYEQGELVDLYPHLDNQRPVIALVRTGELSYWSSDTMHAIVLVGYDDHYFYANDPYFDHFPLQVSIAEFDLAWLEMDNRYAVISI